MKKILFLFTLFLTPSALLAQDSVTASTEKVPDISTSSVEQQIPALPILDVEKKDTTQPELPDEKAEFLSMITQRNLEHVSPFNFLAVWAKKSIELGIPANTIVLILLIPVLATVVAFVRLIIGVQTLELLVPIVLAFAFVAVSVPVGLLILGAVVIASYVARFLLSSLSIMFFPKRALSMTILAFFVFGAMTLAAWLGIAEMQSLSIFPIIILTLMGDSIVSLQLYKSFSETAFITAATISIGLLGYFLASSESVFNFILVYPEVILLTIPANILIGRYFGLRLTEIVRFEQID